MRQCTQIILSYTFLYCIDRHSFPVLQFLRVLLFSEQAHCLWAGAGYEWCWVFYGFALALGDCFLKQRCGGKGKSTQRHTIQRNGKVNEQTKLFADTFIVKVESRPSLNMTGSQTEAWECILMCLLSFKSLTWAKKKKVWSWCHQ